MKRTCWTVAAFATFQSDPGNGGIALPALRLVHTATPVRKGTAWNPSGRIGMAAQPFCNSVTIAPLSVSSRRVSTRATVKPSITRWSKMMRTATVPSAASAP